MPAPWTLFWSNDAAHRTVAVSSNWPQITGQPVAEALGGGWLELVHPEDRARVLDVRFRREMTAATTSSVLCRFKTVDGHVPVIGQALMMTHGVYHGMVQPTPTDPMFPSGAFGPTLVTMAEAAEALSLSTDTLYRWARSDPGQWAIRAGRTWRVDLDALRRWLLG